MFRELIRKKQQLSEAECIEILKKEKRGVLSVIGDDGYPYGSPMNHFYNDSDGCIYFHSAKFGHRIDALKNCDKVSFCVYDEGVRNEGEWALNINSVIVFGKIRLIEDIELVTAAATKLSYKFTDDEEYIQREIRSAAHKTMLLRLEPEHICGKRVNES